jgi:L-lactate dehydrogenase (cytochrome)
MDALPPIIEAVDGKLSVLVDSGVRRGVDVVKAVALGAKAALVGRPYAYAMASHGEAGVRHLIRCLMAEVDLQLALCGLTSISGVDGSLLAD